MDVRVLFWTLAIAPSLGFTTGAACFAGECGGVTAVEGHVLRPDLVSDEVTAPVDIAVRPGDAGRLFVVELAGRIVIVDGKDGSVKSRPFLDIRDGNNVLFRHRRVLSGPERGLLALAFHPDYEKNGYLFVNYTESPSGGTVVARYTVSPDDPDRVDNDSELRILSFDQPSSNHNGGALAFGPGDGLLYIATGDGGTGCDQAGEGENAQNPSSFLGKILRIDVDHTEGDLNYAIPRGPGRLGNPFRNYTGARAEIWALGLRNPWRISFDSETSDLYIGDVGQVSYEEIDYQPGLSQGGENYGWLPREGSHNSAESGCLDVGELSVGTPTDPILEHPRAESGAITGGYVYRGCRMPGLRGTYIYGDFASSTAWAMRVHQNETSGRFEVREHRELFRIRNPTSFGVDEAGEIYVATMGDEIYRLVPALTEFLRGDPNADGRVDLSDAVGILSFLFVGVREPSCRDSADVNDDGVVDSSDAVSVFSFLFRGGQPFVAPTSVCDHDRTLDAVDCVSYPPCGD